MKMTIPAKELKVGDVLPATGQRGPISVKGITVTTHPIQRNKEIKIRGPLGIIEKFHGDAPVVVFRTNK